MRIKTRRLSKNLILSLNYTLPSTRQQWRKKC